MIGVTQGPPRLPRTVLVSLRLIMPFQATNDEFLPSSRLGLLAQTQMWGTEMSLLSLRYFAVQCLPLMHDEDIAELNYLNPNPTKWTK